MNRLIYQAGMSIREAYTQASSFFKERQIQDAAICAEILLQHVLGLSRTEFFFRMEEPFPAAHAEQWGEVVERKAAGEPVQYITGEQEFYGLTLRVTDAVLIPRPETELLVEEILREGSRLFPQGAPLLADIGTGSGAIPVSLLHARPDWRAAACDLSPEALEVAKGNAERCGVGERIAFCEGDLLLPCVERGLPVDILVSNPPYIPAGIRRRCSRRCATMSRISRCSEAKTGWICTGGWPARSLCCRSSRGWSGWKSASIRRRQWRTCCAQRGSGARSASLRTWLGSTGMS